MAAAVPGSQTNLSLRNKGRFQDSLPSCFSGMLVKERAIIDRSSRGPIPEPQQTEKTSTQAGPF